MKDDFHDPILDACLDEMLGEVRPPDLTERILKAWSSRQGPLPLDRKSADRDLPVPTAGSAPIDSEPIPPPIQVLGGSGPATVSSESSAQPANCHAGCASQPGEPPTTRQDGVARRGEAAGHLAANSVQCSQLAASQVAPNQPASTRWRERRRQSWQTFTIATSVVAVATALSVWVVWSQLRGPDREGQVAGEPAAESLASSERGTADGRSGAPSPTGIAGERQGGASRTAAGQASATRRADAAKPATSFQGNPSADRPATSGTSPAETRPNPHGVAAAEGSTGRVPFGRQPPFLSDRSPAPGDSSEPSGDSTERMAWPEGEVVEFVNAEIRDVWNQYEIQPAPPASAEKWCRRVYLRLLGRIPTVAELREFLDDPAEDRRGRLLDRLLEDSEYAAQWADHWAGLWTNVLLGRTGGTEKNQPGDRVALQAYLRDALLEDRPFNQVAHDLISATGSSDPRDDDYNPAVHFVLANMNDKATLLTTRTSRSFLGKQLQCTQCHHHPSNEWDQRQFWELNAFFRQLHVEPAKATGHYRVVNRDFRGESGRDAEEAEIYYERLDGKLQAAYPKFLGREEISPSGLLGEVDRRRELARLVAASDDLDRAVVNRVWNHFLGHGFTRTVDDMGPHSPPSHPDLLKQLAIQFDSHGHSLKSLMRWITQSEPFGLSSREQSGVAADRPDAGSMALFSRYYTRQLPPEEVFQSLQLVASAREESQKGGRETQPPAPGQLQAPVQARQDWLGQFSRDMGTDEGTEISSFQGDIRQSLILMNGSLMRQATDPRDGTVLTQVLQSKMSRDEKVEHLFLAALARKPSRREAVLIGRMLQTTGDERAALQDIWWALLNSNEFILDH